MSILALRFENTHLNYNGTMSKSAQFKAPGLGITAYSLRNAIACMLGFPPVSFLPNTVTGKHNPRIVTNEGRRKTPMGGVCNAWATDAIIKKHTEFYALAKTAKIVYETDVSSKAMNNYSETLSAPHSGEQGRDCDSPHNSDIEFNGTLYENADHTQRFTFSTLQDVFWPVWDSFFPLAIRVCKCDIRNYDGWRVLTELTHAYSSGDAEVAQLVAKMESTGIDRFGKFIDIIKTGKIKSARSLIRNGETLLIRDASFAPRRPAKCRARLDGWIYLDVDKPLFEEFMNGCRYSTLDNGMLTIVENKSGKDSPYYTIDEITGESPLETPDIIVG